ncbi:MAG: phosphoribosylamine--glycine ligase [Bacteroidetes bacterium]|nr:phosphoribosylamine--glycine ligase [Bacteroidota bacterium]HET6245427.1 phosphoribosylamine--glycine ligase [Bacteroidia bacterium]
MKVLILGSGGREHAFAKQIAASPKCEKLYIAPGNAGTAQYGHNAPLSITDFDGIKKFVTDFNITLVLVGPEDPLVNGIADYFLANEELKNIPVIGPGKEGARLEGSKDFAKQFMQRHKIPTAGYKSFSIFNIEQGYTFLESLRPPYVLKADGLAGGKGVVILEDLQQAKAELKAMLEDAKFGEASRKVVIEEFLKGTELSVFVLTDGISYKILPEAKDYKRIGEGDSGLNTGGMGAVSPVPFAGKEFMDAVEKRIIIPTIEGLKKEEIPYKGFIFIGLIEVDGSPYVIEYNVRMGDPETEVVLPRIKTDFLDLLSSVAMETLNKQELVIDNRAAVTVVLVSGGYPGDYEKEKRITGLKDITESFVYHAGTKEINGEIVSDGGRVLAVTSLAANMKDALEASYKNAQSISFEGKYFRKDIGKDLMPS